MKSATDQEKDEAKTALARDIEALIHRIDGSGYVVRGRHASGWLSVYVRDAGNWTIQNQLNPNFPHGKTSEAGGVADLLRATCEQLAALETQGHDPWLNAAWQVKFQAILQGAVIGLSWMR